MSNVSKVPPRDLSFTQLRHPRYGSSGESGRRWPSCLLLGWCCVLTGRHHLRRRKNLRVQVRRQLGLP